MQPAPVKEIIAGSNRFVSRLWNLWFQLVSSALEQSINKTVRITSADSPYTADIGVNLVCNTSAGAIVVNLPPGAQGDPIRVVNAGSAGNSVTVNGNGAENIKGSALQVITDGQVLDARFDSVEGWF